MKGLEGAAQLSCLLGVTAGQHLGQERDNNERRVYESKCRMARWKVGGLNASRHPLHKKTNICLNPFIYRRTITVL